MTSPPSIQGIIPPLVTPLADPERLDVEGLERLIEHLVSGEVDGLFVLGTTGEGPSLSHRLKADLVHRTASLLDDRLPLYVGITDTSLEEALRLARTSAEAGATAVVAAPPFYFPAGQTELAHWYHQLLDELPLPLMLYQIPSCTKIGIEKKTLRSLVSHPGLVGFKDSSGDLDYLDDTLALIDRERPGLPVLVGPEHLLAEALSMGAAGGVPGGANLVPRLFRDLYEAAMAGDAPRLAVAQARVMELQELYRIGKYGSAFLKGVKCALAQCGICSGTLAAPFDAFHLPEQEQVSAWLDSFGQTGLLPEPFPSPPHS